MQKGLIPAELKPCVVGGAIAPEAMLRSGIDAGVGYALFALVEVTTVELNLNTIHQHHRYRTVKP